MSWRWRHQLVGDVYVPLGDGLSDQPMISTTAGSGILRTGSMVAAMGPSCSLTSPPQQRLPVLMTNGRMHRSAEVSAHFRSQDWMITLTSCVSHARLDLSRRSDVIDVARLTRPASTGIGSNGLNRDRPARCARCGSKKAESVAIPDTLLAIHRHARRKERSLNEYSENIP